MDDRQRVGVCLDTCHLFAAGYPIHTEEGWGNTMREFEETIGLENVLAVHVNDSKREFGSRVDRHQHIGQGQVGETAFRMVMNDPRLRGIPKILETEKSEDMHEDVENMARLRALVRGRPGSPAWLHFGLQESIMNPFRCTIAGYLPMNHLRMFLVAMLIASSAHAQSLFTVRDDGERRERTYDVLHYRIEVTIDEVARSVRGAATISLVPLRPALRVVDLDAEALTIESARIAGQDLPFEVFDTKVRVRLAAPAVLPRHAEDDAPLLGQAAAGALLREPGLVPSLAPVADLDPGRGHGQPLLVPLLRFPERHGHLRSHRHRERAFTAVSNGRLVSSTEDKTRRTRTFHWRQSQPHAAYLIMLAAGEYTVLRETAESVPLEYYVYPWHVEDAKVCFRETPAMLRFFNEKIGVKYPWEKYAQVLCSDFVVGGMENTSATTLMDESTVYDARARVDGLPTSLIAHELAHQWWGDLVTCVDWRHLWLNERFASYFDQLYHEHARGGMSSTTRCTGRSWPASSPMRATGGSRS